MNKKLYFRTLLTSTAIMLVLSFAAIIYYATNFINIGGGTDIAELDKAQPNSRQNIVVFGTDDSGLRSDTIMLFSISEKEENINVISIPRDLKVKIGGGFQKINTALAIGKENLAVQTVKDVTGVPVHDYITVNFRAVKDVINALGGVDFYVPQNMHYEDPYQDLYIHLNKGQQHLDGNKALQLLRFRSYPMADIQRTQVQRDFIQAVIDQKLTVANVGKIPEIYDAVSKNIRSSMSLAELTGY
ncbi:MAG: LCP family protein, partial [Clostridia bacterium]|nr:LCP family protein [Clostridia bacterium]